MTVTSVLSQTLPGTLVYPVVWKDGRFAFMRNVSEVPAISATTQLARKNSPEPPTRKQQGNTEPTANLENERRCVAGPVRRKVNTNPREAGRHMSAFTNDSDAYYYY